MNRICYQTVEKRRIRTDSAIYCSKPNAWLGSGYYFWLNENDTLKWGQESDYYRTGYFETYKSEISFDNVLNTVFNENDYNFFLKTIEMAATYFIKKINERPTIKQINDYFREKGIWKSIDGILFQDLPRNETYVLVQELYYKKRIQLVVYNKDIILSFDFHLEGACLK
ncbi:MAG: hypothetical protein M1495_08735 [Bacteroidetes bacterium]|nr:hypothetical protein [Bacteroidota bacterium]